MQPQYAGFGGASGQAEVLQLVGAVEALAGEWLVWRAGQALGHWAVEGVNMLVGWQLDEG